MSGRDHLAAVVDFYDAHPISEHQILEKLERDGVALAGLTEAVLKDYDQDHFGGIAAVDALARSAGITAESHVLDVCSGMGGPARYLADTYGCRVTGIDFTDSRVAGAARLTELVGLGHRVEFRSADALENPFPDQSFDVVVAQEAWCHIPDKPRLVAESVRVTKLGGSLAFTDPLERRPLDQATRARLRTSMAMVELQSLQGYCDLLAGAGCTVLQSDDLSDAWTRILVDRLAMYRGLKDQTVDRFGLAHYLAWDEAYDFFVGLYLAGTLGGGRFAARR